MTERQEIQKPTIRRVRVCDCPMGVRENVDMLSTRHGQVAALAPFLEQAAQDVLTNAAAHWEVDAITGRALACISDGFDLHGRELFDMPDWKLDYEVSRELEDAVVYRAEQLRRKGA